MLYRFMINLKDGTGAGVEAYGETVKEAALKIIHQYPDCKIFHTFDENWKEITPKEIFG